MDLENTCDFNPHKNIKCKYGLSPNRGQAITRNNADIFLIEPAETNLSELSWS